MLSFGSSYHLVNIIIWLMLSFGWCYHLFNVIIWFKLSFVWCFHFINVISFSQSQSDHIKRLLLYMSYKWSVLHAFLITFFKNWIFKVPSIFPMHGITHCMFYMHISHCSETSVVFVIWSRWDVGLMLLRQIFWVSSTKHFFSLLK